MKITMILILLMAFNLFNKLMASSIIEHQVRLCENEQSILEKLSLIPETVKNLQAKEFQVYYLETLKRDFQANNWSLRIRLKKNKIELTVKKKSAPSMDLSTKYPGIICEYDLHGSTKDYSCKLNSESSEKDFKNVLANTKVWTELLDQTQKSFLEDHNALFENALVYGTLEDSRFQWDQKDIGTITLDLVHQSHKEEISFHEISIRYLDIEAHDVASKFENFIKENNLTKCSNQIEWPIDKFEVFEVLNRSSNAFFK